jgi:hypothetical protein
MKALACTLLVACGGDSGGMMMTMVDAPANQSALQFCVQETNRYRTTVPAPGAGAPRAQVTESTSLESYAATGAMYDFTNGPHAHFQSNGGGGIAFAENECPQQGNWTISSGQDEKTVVGACLMAFYSEGPGGGHYENMMGNYGTLGCGLYSNGGKITIVQDYGM